MSDVATLHGTPRTRSALPVTSWGLGDVVLGLVLFAGASVAVIAAVLVDRRGGPTSLAAPTGWALATVLLITVVVFIGVPVLTSRRKGTGSLRTDFGLAVTPGDVPTGLAGGFVAVVFSAGIAALLLGTLGGEVDPGGAYLGVAGVGELAVLHLMVGLLVPVAEELFFRGMLLRSLLGRNGPALSIAASSALFALLHVAGAGELTAVEAARVAATFVSGLVFAGLTLGRGGRLGPAIIAHVVLNQAALSAALY